MSKYTVILLRDTTFADRPDAEEFGKDTYIAYVYATSLKEAVLAAKREALQSDLKDMNGWMYEMQIDTGNYILVSVFEGYPKVVLHGWQE